MSLTVFGYLVLVIDLISSGNPGSAARQMKYAAGLVKTTGCICPGYLVTYECTVMGGQGTLWRGSAFNCEIYLLHDRFVSLHSGENYTKTCNDGDISGRSLGAFDGFYISQLSVKVRSNSIGRTVECAYEDENVVLIGSSTIQATTVPYPPPERPSLSVVDLESKAIVFTWNPVARDCPAIHYNIAASNCGSCPITTNHTTITCTDVPIDGSVCIFAVQTVVCGSITSNASNTAQGVFKATIKLGCTRATASASVLAIVLILLVAIFITIMIIVSIKMKKQAYIIELATQRRRTAVPRYDDVNCHLPREARTSNYTYDEVDCHPPKETVISINKNIAYGNTVEQTDANEHAYAKVQ